MVLEDATRDTGKRPGKGGSGKKAAPKPMLIRTKLFLSFLPLIVLPGLIICYFGASGLYTIRTEGEEVSSNLAGLDQSARKTFSRVEGILVERIISDYNFIAKQLARRLEDRFVELERVAETIAGSKQLEEFLKSPGGELESDYVHPLFETHIRNFGLVEISLLDTTGKEILRRSMDYVPPGGDPLFNTESLPNARQDESGSPWFLKRIGDGTTFAQGAVYFSEDFGDTPTPVLSLTAPLKYKIGSYSPSYGETLAYLHIVVPLVQLLENAVGPDEFAGTVVVVDQGGWILIHPDPARIGLRMDLPYARRKGNLVIKQEALDGLVDLYILVAAEQVQEARKIVTSLGETIEGEVTQIEALSQNTSRRLMNFYAAFFVVTGLSLVLGALLTYVLAKRISAPLSRLAGATRAIARGNMEVAQVVEPGSSVEILRLAETLEDMRSSIKDHIDNLDQKVADRTRELVLAKEEAELANGRLRRANAMLEKLSRFDSLTNIPNRRFFDETLSREWKDAKRQGDFLALLMIDIDFFKRYNDTYGHSQGDVCLRAVGGLLEEVFQRPRDFTARFGGEEFVVVLPETELEGAMHVADMIRTRVMGLGLLHETSTAAETVTVSVGVASLKPDPSLSPETLIDCADKALYEAKRAGRNRIRAGCTELSVDNDF